MDIKDNILRFNYKGIDFNVPITHPWDVYTGGLRKTNKLELSNITFNDKNKKNVKSLTLFVQMTEKCNMACEYCTYGSDGYKDMSIKTIDNLFKYIEKLCIDELEFVFFGGEPLLELNNIKYILNKFNNIYNLKIKYTLYTNGLLFNDEIINIFNKYSIKLVLSLDGTKKMHDSNRKKKNGDGTYDDIINNIEKYRGRLPSKAISLVYNTNLMNESLISIIENLYEKDFNFVYLKLPYADPNSPYFLNEVKVKKFKEMIDDYADECIERIKNNNFSLSCYLNIFQIVMMLLDHRSSISTYGCEAGKCLNAIDVDGNIYPCQSFIEDKNFILKNINNGYENNSLKAEFKKYNMNSNEKCSKCSIKYFCGDLCIYSFKKEGKSLYKPNKFRCEIEKHIIKAAIYIYSNIKDLNNQIRKLNLFLYSKFN